MSYDAHGNLLTVDGPLTGTADTVRYRYDAARRRWGRSRPILTARRPQASGATHDVSTAAAWPRTIETGTVNSQSDGDWAAPSRRSSGSSRSMTATAGRPRRRPISGSTTYALTQSSYDC